MAGFGGAVKLTGESEYRNALKKITQNLKEVSSELKLVSSQYDKNDKSEQAVKARTDALNKALDEQKNKLSLMSTEYKRLSSAYDEQQKKHDALVDSYKKEKDELDRIEKELGTSSEEYQKQQKVVEGLAKDVAKSTEAQESNEKAMSELRTQMNKTQTEINKISKEIDELGDESKESAKQVDELGDETEESGKQADKASKGGWSNLKGVISNLVTDVLKKAVEAVKEFATATVEAGMNFESAMSKVAAISGATDEEVAALTEKAKEMGAKTVFSATESAEAFNYMAMAGWETEDMLNGIEGIMALAAASGEDLATTSDIVTDALTAMGYSAGDAGRLADVMAAASSNANTNVAMMGQTFQYAAPIVGALGYNMEDTAVAIGLMANSGIKAEKAGTALRSILTRLSAPPKECADAMAQLNIELTNSDGSMKSLDDVMGELRTSFSNLSETEQTQIAKQLAGQEAMSGLLAIVNAAPADYEKLKRAVDNANGSSEKMAEVMNDNVGGAMTLLKSQIEGIQIDLYKNLEPTFRRVIEKISEKLKKVNWEKFGEKIGKAFEGAIDVISTIVEVIGKLFSFISDHWQPIVTALGAIAGALLAFKIATVITTVVTALSGFVTAIKTATSVTAAFNAVADSNPFLLIASAIGLVVGGLIAYNATAEEAEENTEKIVGKYDEFVQSTLESADSFRENRDAAAEATNAQIEQVEYVEQHLLPELENLVGANGAVKEGEEARAQFILGELNKALGTEYEQLSDIVGENGKIKDSIYDVIKARKAEIYLNNFESVYQEALSKREDAYNAAADAALEAGKIAEKVHQREQEVIDETNKRLEEYGDITEETRQQAIAFALAEDETLASRKEEYNAWVDDYRTSVNNFRMYEEQIVAYNDASTAALKGNYDECISALAAYTGGLETAKSVANKSSDEQVRILEDQVIQSEAAYQALVESHKETWNSMSKTAKEEAQQQEKIAQEVAERAKMEYENIGGDIMYSTSKGVDGSHYVLNESMKKAVNSAVYVMRHSEDMGAIGLEYLDNIAKGVNAESEVFVRTMSQAGYEAGANYGGSMAQGITDKIGAIKYAAQTAANSAVSATKVSLQIASPSKVARRLGLYFTEGFAEGISDATREASVAAAQMSKQTAEALGESGSMSTSALRANAKKSELGMIDAFKEALAEMKIELDDKVAGKFVERAVARAIYA